MNDMHGAVLRESAEPGTAFEFTGSWREYLPIALTNLLLIIVTLGIYRFWAKARERRYLWSRTRFIDDTLEWTGTGKEMFIGFLAVILVLAPTFFAFGLLREALLMRGQQALLGLFTLAGYAGVLYLIGVAMFRALRYRLSRTYWHGIRGGSDDGGWSFGLEYLWKTVAGSLVFGMLIPWSMTELWNGRWNKMSFGQHPLEAGADTDGLMKRWLLVYAVPIIAVVAGAIGLGGVVERGLTAGAAVSFVLLALVAYVGFLLASVSFYAAYYRKAVSATSWGGVEFYFTARTKDWLKLILGSIGLVIVTLGFGLVFLRYRNWSFAIRHLEATGEIDLDRLLQSSVAAPREAEGFADAFDIGAI